MSIWETVKGHEFIDLACAFFREHLPGKRKQKVEEVISAHLATAIQENINAGWYVKEVVEGSSFQINGDRVLVVIYEQ